MSCTKKNAMRDLILLLTFLSSVQCESSSKDLEETESGLSSGGERVAKCLEHGRFYRNPGRNAQTFWTARECAKYFLCLDGEVFEFRCSAGLLFDVNRQICDFKDNVDNCDVTASVIPKPLLKRAECGLDKLGCGDGTCLPSQYFCDGSMDCPDGSDEGHCEHFESIDLAKPCDQSCKLPECFCSSDGTKVPHNLDAKKIPQMIILTFEDAINFDNFDLYSKLFTSNRKNPNGCPIPATFFVSHQYNNYHQTQKLWNNLHEIGVHSITHRGPEDWWSYNATVEDYFDEMIGMANILHKYSNIRPKEIRGMRVPFLRVGWNRQFLMAKEFGFMYDSSIVAPYNDPPLWPYTLDHQISHKCQTQNCPNRSYPGVWEIVLNPMVVNQKMCVLIDTCPGDLQQQEIFKMLIHNFKRHYLTNRAPLTLNFHSAWFKRGENFQAFNKFLDEMLQYEDVWFVTGAQAIEWIQNPVESFQCNKDFNDLEMACNLPNICKLHSRIFQQERYFHTCSPCPQKYPWIRNEFGLD